MVKERRKFAVCFIRQNSMIKHYADYSTEDFAADELFIRWVQNPRDEEVHHFWQTLMRNNPYKNRQINLARQLVNEIFQGKEDDLNTSETHNLWKRIRDSIHELPEVQTLVPEVKTFATYFYFWRWASASIAAILFIGWIFWTIPARDEFLVVQTSVGQPRRIVLSDGSVVQLNGQSTLRYAREWSLQKDREIWLNGNGYFDVRPTHDDAKFKIHVNGVVLQAQNTSLNISQSPSRLRIELSDGVLLLDGSNVAKPIQMRSGDILELDLKNHAIIHNYNYLVAN